jgi:hypothetical protein
MCNIQNRSIPAVQLTQLRKLSNKNFQGTGVLKSSQSCQVLQCRVAARQWRCLAEIVSFSGSCSRCLVLSLLPCPTLPKYPKLVCGYCVKGLSDVQGAVPCQRHWYQDHAIRCGRCAHQLSERANASSPCLNLNHKPLGTNKNVVVEACKRLRRCPNRL